MERVRVRVLDVLRILRLVFVAVRTRTGSSFPVRAAASRRFERKTKYGKGHIEGLIPRRHVGSLDT